MTDEAGDTAAELASIQQTMRSDYGAYASDPGMQARYLDLLSEREAPGTTPAVDPTAAELAGIEQRIRIDGRAYWGDPAMQDRHLELLTAKEDGAELRADAPAFAISDLGDPVEVLADYRSGGKYETADVLVWGGTKDPVTNVAAVNFTGLNIARDIGDEDGANLFLESFNRLPDKAQAQTFASLLTHADDAPEATPAELQTFLDEDDAGETLAAEWGEDAAFHLGVAKARLADIFAGLSADEKREAEHFVTSAPEAEWAAILRQLANPAAVQTRSAFQKIGRA